MLIPARRFIVGKGIDDFRNDMLDDKYLKLLYDYQHPDEVFYDRTIGGLSRRWRMMTQDER